MRPPWSVRHLTWDGGTSGLVTKSCLTLLYPMDCSLPGSSVHGVSQTRILEWVAISFSRSWDRSHHKQPYRLILLPSLVQNLRLRHCFPQNNNAIFVLGEPRNPMLVHGSSSDSRTPSRLTTSLPSPWSTTTFHLNHYNDFLQVPCPAPSLFPPSV